MSFTLGYFLMKLFRNIGNKVGIIVGIIPNLNSPPINFAVRLYLEYDPLHWHFLFYNFMTYISQSVLVFRSIKNLNT
jgi:hypothetical protein